MIINDQSQRQQALSVDESFIVQAPAGSGKTELLTQRFLNLLTTVDNGPEEILAITFTKKAANEMRNRIIIALRLAEQAEPDEAHKKTTWQIAKRVQEKSQQQSWDLMNNPNRLRIQTIDSFCASLIKQMPMLSELGANINIVDDAKAIYQQAANAVIASLEDNEAWSESLATLLLHLDNNVPLLTDLFSNMLSHRDQWLPHVVNARHNEDLREHLEMALLEAVESTLIDTMNAFPLPLASECIELFNIGQHNLGQDTVFDRLPESTASQLSAWQQIAAFLLTQKHQWRKTIDKRNGFPTEADTKEQKAIFKEQKGRMKALLGTLSEFDELRDNLEHVLHLPEPNYDTQQWNILTALLDLLPILAAQLQVLFRQTGQIDFTEITQRALLALGEDDKPTDLALHLDYKLKHILVDEFQDTSSTQFRLLEKLTRGWQADDGRTLFLVGDPMQSIYRFRAAEVGLFLKAKEYGIGEVPLMPLTLTSNFRSQAGIVNWVNNSFTHIFPQHDDMGSGSVAYSASTAVHAEQAQAVQCYLHTDAQAIADIILQTDSQHSIAILVKSRSQLYDILPALKTHNISYQAIDIERLDHLHCIQDLTALTTALTHLADRLAWLSILRAPWCGLTLNDLTIIASDKTALIWQQINNSDIQKQLSQDGLQRLHKLLPPLQYALQQRQRQTLRNWIYSTWLAIGGAATLSEAHELNNVNAFFACLDDLDESGSLSSVEKLQHKLSNLYAEPDNQANARVHIMTIHKSKGLEFDTVILPCLQQKTQSDREKLLLWQERPTHHKTDLLLAPIKAKTDAIDPIYRYIKRQEQMKADFEASRLLYVAATRAKQSLHLLANPDINEDKEYKPPTGSLLAKLWPHCQDKFNTIASVEDINEETASHELTRVTSDFELPEPLSVLLPKPQHVPLDANLPVWQDPTASIFGSLVHQLLERMSQVPQAQWPTFMNEAWSKRLTQLGKAQNQDAMLQQLQALLKQLTNSETAQWILTPHNNAQSEYALKAKIDGAIQHIVIDRAFEFEGNYWIIDYKTSSNENTEKHQRQLEKYAEIIAQTTNLPIKIALYFPLTDVLTEL
tara:strand:+ start:78858 stop:82088 length:3231 start_codon:yes stop_codon:yes gene_type:complete